MTVVAADNQTGRLGAALLSSAGAGATINLGQPWTGPTVATPNFVKIIYEPPFAGRQSPQYEVVTCTVIEGSPLATIVARAQDGSGGPYTHPANAIWMHGADAADWAALEAEPVRAQAAEALLTPRSRDGVVLHDEFSRYGNVGVAGLVPMVGPAWLTSGAQLPTIVSGKAETSGAGYIYADLSPAPYALTCELSWSGAAGDLRPMAMAWSSDSSLTLAEMLHFNFGPVGFSLTIRQNSGSFDALIQGQWTVPMVVDGAAVHRITIACRGNRIIIIGPSGDVFSSPADPRVALCFGPIVFWEPGLSSGLQAQLVSASAFSRSSTGLSPLYVDLDFLAGISQVTAGATGYAASRTAGSRDSAGEVLIGIDPVSTFPAIQFGPSVIYTTLAVAATAGQASIETVDRISNGATIQIESGSNSEVVTQNAYVTGAWPGPFTSAISGTLAHNHAAGVAVIAIQPASAIATAYWLTDNAWLFMPNAATFFPFGQILLGSGLDTIVKKLSAGLVSLPGLAVVEGSNAKQGTAVLVAGSKVVACTSVTANSRIILTSNADGGTPGWLRVSARTPGVSFTITSSSGADTSTVAYEIFEPG